MYININKEDIYNHYNSTVGHNLRDLSLSLNQKNIYIKANADLDKYYTKSHIAKKCYESIKGFLNRSKVDITNTLFIEPSAGSGVFLKHIKEASMGFDLAPTTPGIYKNDFLKGDIKKFFTLEDSKKQTVFIGNPPFGKKSDLAIQFINRAFKYGSVVGFILPIQFRKWSAQNKIDPRAKLVVDMDLPEKAFEFMGEDYGVRCCFQVWVLNDFPTQAQDLRMKHKPEVSHEDFEIYQFNRTKPAERYFDYDWDFAVPRQGFNDYTVKVINKNQCDRKKQWIFFKAKNPKVLSDLLKIDFEKLSKKNIGIPGFGKADVVEEYKKLYNK